MFYLLFKNKWVEHQLEYVGTENDSARIEPTLPGKSGRPFLGSKYRLVNDQPALCLIDVMSKDLISVSHTTPLKDCYQIFESKGIHHLIVEDHGRFIGVISDRDVATYKKVPFAADLKAESITTNIVLAAHESVTVGQAALALNREKISCLPVLNDDTELVGIVTLRDMARVLSEIIL